MKWFWWCVTNTRNACFLDVDNDDATTTDYYGWLWWWWWAMEFFILCFQLIMIHRFCETQQKIIAEWMIFFLSIVSIDSKRQTEKRRRREIREKIHMHRECIWVLYETFKVVNFNPKCMRPHTHTHTDSFLFRLEFHFLLTTCWTLFLICMLHLHLHAHKNHLECLRTDDYNSKHVYNFQHFKCLNCVVFFFVFCFRITINEIHIILFTDDLWHANFKHTWTF